MSDYTGNEGSSRRRDRHRRGRGGRGGQGGAQREAEARQGGGENRGRGDPQRRTDATHRDGNRVESPNRVDSRARFGDGGRGRDEGRRNEVSRDNRDGRRAPREEAIPLPKLPTPVCPKCGQPIQDITSALNDKESGSAMHFDCVIKFLEGAENLGPNEKIAYIGQGRFAVMVFENPQDLKKFKINRVIEWESREARPEWRSDIAGLFSQIK
jgi:hypothetical protein